MFASKTGRVMAVAHRRARSPRALELAFSIALGLLLIAGGEATLPAARAGSGVPFCGPSSCGWTGGIVPLNVTTSEVSLWAAAFWDAQIVVTVGNLGTILRSTNAGVSWTPVTDPAPAIDLNTIARDPGGTLWAAGGDATVLRSVDGGLTWSPASTTGLTGNVTDLAFPDSSASWFAYAATSSGLFLSRDRGQDWTEVATPVGKQLRSVAFFDPLHGWVEGGATPGQVFYTSDGGVDWTPGITGGQPTDSSALVATGPTQAWMLGVQDLFFETSDGTNWSVLQLASAQRSQALAVQGGQTGWAAAQDANLFYTTDGGGCWMEEGVPQIPEIYGFAFYNASTGVAVGDGVAWYTRDAGVSSFDVPGVEGGSACTFPPPADDFRLVLLPAVLAGLLASLAIFWLSGPRRRGPRGPPGPSENREMNALKGRARYRSRKRFVGSR